MAGALRRVRVYTVPGFRRRYQRFSRGDPKVRSAMRTFNEAKRLIPPAPLPREMQDHKLHFRLKGFSECHLAPDVLLVYTHENDVVTLLDCCTHAELQGDSGERRIRAARRIATARARAPKRRH